jgi:hypothetical protein
VNAELKYIRALLEELRQSIITGKPPENPISPPAYDTAIISEDATLMALVASHPNTLAGVVLEKNEGERWGVYVGAAMTYSGTYDAVHGYLSAMADWRPL